MSHQRTYCNIICYSKFPKSKESRAKMSLSGKGKKKPEGFGAKISAASKGVPKPWQKGDKNINFGGKLINRIDIKDRHAAAVKKRGLAWTKEDCEKHSIKMKGTSNKMRGKKHTECSKAKMKASIQKLIRTRKIFRSNKISKPEKDIAESFDILKIPYEQQFHIKTLPYNYDFYLIGTNILIEFQGDYWHCNPRKFKSGQYVRFHKNIETMVDDIWKRDLIKKQLAENMGYKVVQIWQCDYVEFGMEFIIQELNKEGLNL